MPTPRPDRRSTARQSAPADAFASRFENSGLAEKQRFIEEVLERKRVDLLCCLVRETAAVREGFLFELPDWAPQELRADSQWEQAREAKVAEFCAASPEARSERIRDAYHSGQFGFLRYLVMHTRCVAEGFLCEWPQGVFAQYAEEHRVRGLEEALTAFGKLSDWQKVCRIRNARKWWQWGFLKAVICRTDSVAQGLLWDPPEQVVPFANPGKARFRNRGDETVSADSEGEAGERSGFEKTVERWNKGIARWWRDFSKASLAIRRQRVERLVVLGQWKTVAEILRRCAREKDAGEGDPNTARTRRIKKLASLGSWRTLARAIPFPGQELLRDEEAFGIWADAVSRAPGGRIAHGVGEGSGESRVCVIQEWRAQANRWVAGDTPSDSGKESADACRNSALGAIRQRVQSAGFRTGLRFFSNVDPQRIPVSLRADPEVVLGDWRQGWEIGGSSLGGDPGAALRDVLEQVRRRNAHAAEWPEDVPGDTPEARAVWAWTWVRQMLCAEAADTSEVPVVPAPLRHIPQVVRAVVGVILERLDTEIARNQSRFPDVERYSDGLLSAGLWDAAGHRCAARVRWMGGGTVEIRQIPALLRNHPGVLALCAQGRVFLDPAIAGSEAALGEVLRRQPVPWCLIPQAARGNATLRQHFVTGWNGVVKRAVPAQAFPAEIFAGADAAPIPPLWLRAWRTLAGKECTPRHWIPDVLWNGDARLRCEMLGRWCAELREMALGVPGAEKVSLEELESWYAAWSEGWMLHPRPPEWFWTPRGKASRVSLRAGSVRVEVARPDDGFRQNAVRWHARLLRGELPLGALPRELFHVPEVVEAWMAGRLNFWGERSGSKGGGLQTVLKELGDAPLLWWHQIHAKRSFLKKLVKLLLGLPLRAGQEVDFESIPVWIRECLPWKRWIARERVQFPKIAGLMAGPEETETGMVDWLRKNPASPGMLEALNGVRSPQIQEACREGWLKWCRGRAVPVGVLPREFAGKEISDARIQGWRASLSSGGDLIPVPFLQSALAAELGQESGGEAAKIQTELQRLWLRWAEKKRFLQVFGGGDDFFVGVENSVEEESRVGMLFNSWHRAWAFSIRKDLKVARETGFTGFSHKGVVARIREWLMRENAFLEGNTEETHRRAREEAFANALFSTWVWAIGADPSKLSACPDFLEETELRERHLAGWRCVLQKRASDPENVPKYVLEDEGARAALRRGWCSRLEREAVPLKVIPSQYRKDAAIRSAWGTGWERQLKQEPLSAWQIPGDLRREDRIRDAWKAGWLERFATQPPDGEIDWMAKFFFPGNELLPERSLWIAPLLTKAPAEKALDERASQKPKTKLTKATIGWIVPRGYRDAEAEIRAGCRKWAERFLAELQWNGQALPAWKNAPGNYAALCRRVQTLPSWEKIAAEIRALQAVRAVWMERHPVSASARYQLEKMATRNEWSDAEGRGALDALFDRPWAVHALSRKVQKLAEVQRAVREGWAEKLRQSPVYGELREVCEGEGKG